MKVIVDGFGGDYSPEEIVKGCILAVKDFDINVVITGDENKIKEILKQNNCDSDRIEIIDAKDVINNNEAPTVAIRQKTESSLVKAFNELRTNDEIVGLVSAGSTGAVLTGAFLKLGRIAGVSRPALCPLLPTYTGGQVAIVDCGANMDSKPINLVHFALMGNAYLKNVLKIDNPRVALLNVGVEEHKGNDLSKQVFDMLSNLKEINFVGNMEARELLSGDVDLVVTDGFAGNVLLKSTEGAVLNLLKIIKREIYSSVKGKIGGLLLKKSFKNVKKIMDYNDKGGAVLLGCKKVVVKSHGTSKAESIKASIEQVIDAAKANVCEIISESINNIEKIEEN